MLTFVAFLFLVLTMGPAGAESGWQPFAAFKDPPAGAPSPSSRSKAAVAKESRPAPAPSFFSLLSNAQTAPEASLAPAPEAVLPPPKPMRPELKAGTSKFRWQITKPAWTRTEEADFEAFITALGESDCATVHECLTKAASNPRFHDKNPPGVHFFADCADLPFILRGYFAWQNGLPFSFPVRLVGHPMTPGHSTRLTGYAPAERYDIVGPGPEPKAALDAVSYWVSSEHFRTPPAFAGKLLPDHYPVKISREGIRPGTVIFDPDGHIAVVYKVTEDGRVHYIDAHPDNSLTRGVFNREFARAEPPMGAGFKRWRPQSLEGARQQPDGTWVGGKVVLAADAKLDVWSDEQFFGNQTPRPADWKDGKFVIDGQVMDYHEYVRLRLAQPGFKYDPLGESRAMLRQICSDLRYRVDAVNRAVVAGIDRKPMPARLPQNIYATQGDWEIYSTPSRDARLKTAFEEFRDEITRFLRLARDNSRIIAYQGHDLRADLKEIYRTETAACTITYTRSDGVAMQLSFEDLKQRLFRLSFNPYTCVERRWGATSAEELASCRDDKHKAAWYEAEDRLRNQLVRTYGEKMGWGLAELQNRSLDIGIEEQPDVDPWKALERELEPVAEAGSAQPPPGSTKAAQRVRAAARSTARVPVRAAVRPALPVHKASAKLDSNAARRKAPAAISNE